MGFPELETAGWDVVGFAVVGVALVGLEPADVRVAVDNVVLAVVAGLEELAVPGRHW